MSAATGKTNENSARPKIRAIDQGTRYDLTGMLRKAAREIERGEWGDVRDIVLITKRKVQIKNDQITVCHYGAGTDQELHWMVSVAKNRTEPA